MSVKSPLTLYCEKRGISGQIRSAFGAYIRAQYADKLQIRESGETVHVLLNRMSEEDLDEAWNDFVKDLYSSLPKTSR